MTNLVTTVFKISLSFKKAEDGIMEEPPRPQKKNFNKRLTEETFIAAFCYWNYRLCCLLLLII